MMLKSHFIHESAANYDLHFHEKIAAEGNVSRFVKNVGPEVVAYYTAIWDIGCPLVLYPNMLAIV
jgi:hypothetical protein